MKQTKKLNLKKIKIASINKIGLEKIVGGDTGNGKTTEDTPIDLTNTVYKVKNC